MREERTDIERYYLMRIMAYIAAGVTVAMIVLRTWLFPSVRDWETGLFTPNNYLMIATVLAMVVMAVLGLMSSDGPRHEIAGAGCKATAVAMLVTGLVLLVTEGIAFYGSLMNLRLLGMAQGQSMLIAVLAVSQNAFGILSGLSFIMLGMRLLSEGATRRGISQWSVLVPVAWLWFRLVNYEVSYASMVRLSDSFYGLLMMILELIFLFKMARFMSGVGRMRTGMMAFYSFATAMFSLSAPVVRMIMYLMGDNTAYEAHHLAGLSDFAIGLVALGMGLSLLSATLKAHVDFEEASPAPGTVDAGDLLMVDSDFIGGDE